MKNQKGQSFASFAVGLAFVALLAFLAWMAFWSVYGSSLSTEAINAATTTWNNTTTDSHADIHGQEAIDAKTCLDKHGAAQIWINGRRKAEVCYEGSNFFIRIVDKITGEVTMFKRTGARTLGDVGNYLKASGYTR